MIISLNSFKTFVLVNSFLLSLGFFQYKFMEHFTKEHTFFLVYIIFLFRNYVLLTFVNFITHGKPNITNDTLHFPKEDYKYEFHYNVITATAVETCTHIIIKNNIIVSLDLWNGLVYFIPVSFCFEIVYDFFHYFSHRLVHSKHLYKYHKKHHKFKYPIAITTFYQDPIDLLLTNSLPLILTVSFVHINYFQFNLLIIYKTFIEISGHVSKNLYPACCFTQFIWLPKILNIELYAEDHILHHSSNNCNYAKRFSLWDKLFGTFTSSKCTKIKN